MLEVMMDELRAATRDFYNMTGIMTVLYDESRRVLYSYPSSMCTFCQTVRRSEALTVRCKEFDNVGFDMCDKTGKPYIYRCHMGLAEAITPIREGDMIIGYMMMGQILCDGARGDVERAMREAARSHGLPLSDFERGLSELTSVGDEFIRSALSVMSMCVCYLYTNRIIRSRSEDLSARLRAYVEHHYTEALTVPVLCRRMYISKSKLYQLSLQAFGMGVSDYIRMRRLEAAKGLLVDTDRPIAEIAQRVGFDDANYFTRAFREAEGTTPSAYRAEHQKNTL